MEASRHRSAPQRRRREEVLRAAAELFVQRGYDATTTGDIADRLGILRGSVYYYFDTKEGLLFELIEDVYVGALALQREILGRDTDALERLRELVERHVAYLAENVLATALFLNELRALSPEHRAIVTAQEAAYAEGVGALIAEGRRAGVIRADVDDRLATMAVLGAVNWVHRWYRADGGTSAQEIGRQFAGILADGLAARR